jgi:hypothetical protein
VGKKKHQSQRNSSINRKENWQFTTFGMERLAELGEIN